MNLFITCPRGLEYLLDQELKRLGLSRYTPFSWNAVFKINYLSRLAGRVLMPLTRFRCMDDKDLYSGASKIDWAPYFPEGVTLAIDANVSHEKLRHSLYAAQVVKDAICDQLKEKRPSIDTLNPDVQLNLFINREHATLSFDTSGAPLHRRGYRQATVAAPLQETLAAGILAKVGYDGGTLCDPCCGSGTILIEAAMMATKTPAGFFRKQWGFFRHPDFDPQRWMEFRKKWDEKRSECPRLVGIDKDLDAIRAARKNSEFPIEWHCKPFEEYPEERFDWIVTNPPYGRRLSGNLKPLSQFLTRSDRSYFLAGAEQVIPFPTQRMASLHNGNIQISLARAMSSSI